MHWFNRFKLTDKLLITLLTCSALTAAVGGYGPLRIAAPERNPSLTFTENLLPMQEVDELQFAPV